ncbi:MAG: hypothetical protein LBT95_09460 [Treponema sp.]|jgi:hypothetical protein|nr:hypothetical protein [Treponema sp.]
MKRYGIKCRPDSVEYFDILEETEEGFYVKVVRIKNGSERVIKEFITRSLFNICLKTGYISEAKEASSSVA